MIFPWMAEESAQVYQDLDGWLRDLQDASQTERSPVMRPVRDSGYKMMEDMGEEGMRYVHFGRGFIRIELTLIATLVV